VVSQPFEGAQEDGAITGRQHADPPLLAALDRGLHRILEIAARD
jgi:hypothetical protein